MREPPKSLDTVNSNSLNVILGAAVATDNSQVYDLISERLGESVRCSFDDARYSTSWSEIKHAIEMSLQAAILGQKYDIVKKLIEFNKKRKYLIGVAKSLLEEFVGTLMDYELVLSDDSIEIYRLMVQAEILIRAKERTSDGPA